MHAFSNTIQLKFDNVTLTNYHFPNWVKYYITGTICGLTKKTPILYRYFELLENKLPPMVYHAAS